MPETTTTAETPVARPETFRLPKPGESDKFFGFSRSWYYAAEARGWLQLIRFIEPGRRRGVTLVPFRKVQELVRSQMEAQQDE